MSKTLDKNSDKPLYVQLKEIVQERLPHDEDLDLIRLPSERKLASEYGVSRMTARQALKALGQELSIQRNGQGTFFDKKSTQSLEIIRFVFPNNWSSLAQNSFYSNIFSGAEKRAHDYECDLIFSTLGPNKQLLSKIKPTDCVILVGECSRATIKKISEIGCKLCLVDCNTGSNNLGWDQVCVDNEQGSALAADVFKMNKHKKCAYIDSYIKPASFAFKQRHKAFINRLDEQGIAHSGPDDFEMDWDSIESNTEDILAKLIKNEYTAVYASHTHFAIDLIECARKQKVDHQLSIIGFGDDAAARSTGLNVIDVPEYQIGQHAIEQIIKSYNNGWCLKQNALISTEYIDRGSVHTI